jgi:UDPglucose 6-dehydrogenase
MTTEPLTIGVVGAGYVGLVTAVSFAQLGHQVTCLDLDAGKVAGLRAGSVPFHEPGLNAALCAASPNLRFTTHTDVLYRTSSTVFVCVDTPPRADGAADLSRVDGVIAGIPGWARPLLVMKSTVPVGTGTRILERLRAGGRPDIRYVSNPEFLREGSAMQDVSAPDRIVIGGDDPDAVDRVAALYARSGCPIVRTDTTTAEAVKYAANSFLATKISFINEIAGVCEALGADIDTVSRGIGLDRRIGPAFLQAGIGYGGSCFAKDISALQTIARAAGCRLDILPAVARVNTRQRLLVVEKLEHHLGTVSGARIAVLGLAFKPQTDDLRDSPGVDVARALIDRGVDVVVHDPAATARARDVLPEVTMASTLAEALQAAEAAVIATDWPQYSQLLAPAMSPRMRHPLLIDGRNLLQPADAERAGYLYDSIGRPGLRPAVPAKLRLAA